MHFYNDNDEIVCFIHRLIKNQDRLVNTWGKFFGSNSLTLLCMWNFCSDNIFTAFQKDNDEIVCDEALKKAFGQAKVQRSEILKFLDVNLTRLKPGCHAWFCITNLFGQFDWYWLRMLPILRQFYLMQYHYIYNKEWWSGHLACFNNFPI